MIDPEPILLSDFQASKQAPPPKRFWLGWIMLSIVMVAAVGSGVYYFSSNTAESQAAIPLTPFLSSSRQFGECRMNPDDSSFVKCLDRFMIDEEKDVSCPIGYGSIDFYDVKLGGRRNPVASAAMQKECQRQAADWENMISSGEPGVDTQFKCSFVLQDLIAGLKNGDYSKYTDGLGGEDEFFGYDGTFFPDDVEGISPEGQVVLARPGPGFDFDFGGPGFDFEAQHQERPNGPGFDFDFGGPESQRPERPNGPNGRPQRPDRPHGPNGPHGPPHHHHHFDENQVRIRFLCHLLNGGVWDVVANPADDYSIDDNLPIDDLPIDDSYPMDDGLPIDDTQIYDDYPDQPADDQTPIDDTTPAVDDTSAEDYYQEVQDEVSGGSELLLRSTYNSGEPFLTNINVHCGGERKPIADDLELAKLCHTQDFNFECDDTRDDPRIIITKFKQDDVHKGRKKAKARSTKANDLCSGSGATCSLAMEDLLLTPDDGEGAFDENIADFDGKTFTVKYMCSYAPDMLDGGEDDYGYTDTDFVDPNGEYFLGSSLEEPSDQFLESALTRCGRTKTFSSNVEVKKVCNDVLWDFTCDDARQGARIIILGFLDPNNHSTKRQGKLRAGIATDACAGIIQNSSCSLNLEDVLLDGETADGFVDPLFNVKYLCSYAN